MQLLRTCSIQLMKILNHAFVCISLVKTKHTSRKWETELFWDFLLLTNCPPLPITSFSSTAHSPWQHLQDALHSWRRLSNQDSWDDGPLFRTVVRQHFNFNMWPELSHSTEQEPSGPVSHSVQTVKGEVLRHRPEKWNCKSKVQWQKGYRPDDKSLNRHEKDGTWENRGGANGISWPCSQSWGIKGIFVSHCHDHHHWGHPSLFVYFFFFFLRKRKFAKMQGQCRIQHV